MSDLVERVAAELWRVEVVDSGTPASLVNERTYEAFADQSEVTRAKWHKFSRAAVSMVLDAAAGLASRSSNGYEWDLRREEVAPAIRALGGEK